MALKHVTSEEPRYDAATLKKVTALAQRLQAAGADSLSAGEIANIGAEIGLQPAYISAALAEITTAKTEVHAPGWLTRENLTALGGASAYSLLTYFLTSPWDPNGYLLLAFWLVFPAMIPFLIGLKPGKSRLATKIGSAIIAANAVAVTFIASSQGAPDVGLAAFLYCLIGLPTVAALGNVGAFWRWLEVREDRRRGRRAKSEPSRQELLQALFELQQRLEGAKVHRAFLSVDVAGTAEMKRGESELAVEYSFGELAHWLREIVETAGGQVFTSVGDDQLCLFPDEAAAARAAKQIHERLGAFNASHNRLSRPFRLRCGIAGGEVSESALRDTGRPASWLVDQAIALQRSAAPGDILISETAAPNTLAVLGSLARENQSVEGEAAFSWRGQSGLATTG